MTMKLGFIYGMDCFLWKLNSSQIMKGIGGNMMTETNIKILKVCV